MRGSSGHRSLGRFDAESQVEALKFCNHFEHACCGIGRSSFSECVFDVTCANSGSEERRSLHVQRSAQPRTLTRKDEPWYCGGTVFQITYPAIQVRKKEKYHSRCCEIGLE
jgi:hypothetical protein